MNSINYLKSLYEETQIFLDQMERGTLSDQLAHDFSLNRERLLNIINKNAQLITQDIFSQNILKKTLELNQKILILMENEKNKLEEEIHLLKKNKRKIEGYNLKRLFR